MSAKRTRVQPGQRFGRLVARTATDERISGSVVWDCLCDCGAESRRSASLLKSGDARSCGCLLRDYRAQKRTTALARLNDPSAPAWSLTAEGYIRTQVAGRSILQHRYLMERELGRPLLPNESVHHINGVRHDNRLENLELWSSSHPAGQRVEDKIKWAKDILALYEPASLQASK